MKLKETFLRRVIAESTVNTAQFRYCSIYEDYLGIRLIRRIRNEYIGTSEESEKWENVALYDTLNDLFCMLQKR